MDYKKLHEDTITKLQEMVNSGKITVEVARGICADFEPESDDERIRKAVISAVESLSESPLKVKMLAWLEKRRGNLMGALQEANKKIGELVEENYYLKEQDEQKHAWSEEDKEQLDFCCAAIEMSNYSSDEYRNYAISFLESLKDRVQPKQEWSEDDETMIALLHNIISHQYSMDIIKKEEQLKLEDWLKYLRPQNTWKPSDEQMDALDFAADCIVPDEFCYKKKYLKSLLTDLKQL